MYIYVYLRTLNGFIMSSYSVMLPFTHTVGKSSFHQSISSSKYHPYASPCTCGGFHFSSDVRFASDQPHRALDTE